MPITTCDENTSNGPTRKSLLHGKKTPNDAKKMLKEAYSVICLFRSPIFDYPKWVFEGQGSTEMIKIENKI